MTLALHGRSARLALDRADSTAPAPGAGPQPGSLLSRVLERELSPPGGG